MLDFRQGHRRREGQDAGQRQWLVPLVLGLGIVMVLVGWAKDAGVRRGLNRLMGGSSTPPAAVRDNHPATAEHKDLPPGGFVIPSEVAADATPRPVAAADVIPPAAAAPDTKPRPAVAPNPRQVFRELGVGDRYFDQLHDGGPIGPAEVETLLRVMYRLRIFPAADIQRWALPAGELSQSLARPEAFRGSIFRLRGTVTAVEPYQPPADAAQRFKMPPGPGADLELRPDDMPKYFRCRLRLDSSEQTVEIFSEHVPEAWRKGARPDAPGGAMGVFLKLGDKSDAVAAVFAAPRLAWYPDDLLGRLGMDAGLLDAVQDQKGLTGEQEAFYQMLAAAGRAEPDELMRQAEAALPESPKKCRWTDPKGNEFYSVAPLFEEPAAHRGELRFFQGTARRIEEVRIDDPAVATRFGFDHYYLVSLFTGDCEFKLAPSKIVLPYPVSFFVRELPKGMPYGKKKDYAESVRVAGFFFKTWSYPVSAISDSTLPPGDRLGGQQLSPLLIGRSLVWLPPPTPVDPMPGNMAILGLLIVVMLTLWMVAWQWRRGERRQDRLTVGEPPRFDLNTEPSEPPRDAGDAPDFSRLAELDKAAEEHGGESESAETRIA